MNYFPVTRVSMLLVHEEVEQRYRQAIAICLR